MDDLAVKGLDGGSFHDSILVVGVRCGNLAVLGLGAVDNESHRGERGAGGGLAKGGSELIGNCDPCWRGVSPKGCDRGAERIAM
jgi:hypothetical protein